MFSESEVSLRGTHWKICPESHILHDKSLQSKAEQMLVIHNKWILYICGACTGQECVH